MVFLFLSFLEELKNIFLELFWDCLLSESVLPKSNKLIISSVVFLFRPDFPFGWPFLGFGASFLIFPSSSSINSSSLTFILFLFLLYLLLSVFDLFFDLSLCFFVFPFGLPPFFILLDSNLVFPIKNFYNIHTIANKIDNYRARLNTIYENFQRHITEINYDKRLYSTEDHYIIYLGLDNYKPFRISKRGNGFFNR